MKAAPPLLPTSVGKRHILPKPTAEPADAKITPIRLPNFPLLVESITFTLIINQKNGAKIHIFSYICNKFLYYERIIPKKIPVKPLCHCSCHHSFAGTNTRNASTAQHQFVGQMGSFRHVWRYVPCHLVGILATASANRLATRNNRCDPFAYHLGNIVGIGSNLPHLLSHRRLARRCCQRHRSYPWSRVGLLYFAQDL